MDTIPEETVVELITEKHQQKKKKWNNTVEMRLILEVAVNKGF